MELKNRVLPIAVLIALISRQAQAQRQYDQKTCAPEPSPGAPPSSSFCSLPPTVPDLAIEKYAQGVWYQIYGSGSTLRFSSNNCVTANYTLRSDGKVDILNCQYSANMSRPQCTAGVAGPRDGVNENSKLVVSFEGIPKSIGNPANYNVAAVIGSPETGYYAAAVYQCLQPPNGPGLPGFYIISRTSHCPMWALQALVAELKCLGYDTSAEFTPVQQENCKYFFDSGFETFRS